jgi:hypothetical protein
MEVKMKYRGRSVTEEDLSFIRKLIADNPTASRHALSKRLCEAWGWRQPNGVLRDMVCRGLMLALHRAGHLELPPARLVARNPFLERQKPVPVSIDTTPVLGTLAELRPLEFRQVRRTTQEPLFNAILQEHHYLGYTQPVGEHLKYLIYAHGKVVACMAWSSAPRHLGPRDRFIGWPPEARRKNIRFIAYNTRFLILPWVRVPHLASYILARMARVLPEDWRRLYRHPVYYLETFIDPDRFRGTCYRAANWIPLGLSSGRGKNDQTHKPNRSLKEILGYPLLKDFRRRLREGMEP